MVHKLISFIELLTFWFAASSKGQIKPSADFHAVDSPKKQTNEFGFFAVKSIKAKKLNSFVHFLGKSTARQSDYGFIWPLHVLG